MNPTLKRLLVALKLRKPEGQGKATLAARYADASVSVADQYHSRARLGIARPTTADVDDAENALKSSRSALYFIPNESINQKPNMHDPAAIDWPVRQETAIWTPDMTSAMAGSGCFSDSSSSDSGSSCSTNE